MISPMTSNRDATGYSQKFDEDATGSLRIAEDVIDYSNKNRVAYDDRPRSTGCSEEFLSKTIQGDILADQESLLEKAKSISQRSINSNERSESQANASAPAYLHSEEIVLDTFTGRVIGIEGEIARVQLVAEDGTEYVGTHPLSAFNGLSVCNGSYFSCKTVQTNGKVKAVIGPPVLYGVSEREMANLKAELRRVYGGSSPDK